MTFLAIDYGAQRLGLAISDDAGRLALPLQTLSRRPNDMNGDLAALLSLIGVRGVESIVIGIPGGSEQSEATAAKARRFVTRLEKAAIEEGTQLSFFETDERYSTAQAHNELRDAGISMRQSRTGGGAGSIDARSAAVFLQTFLDARNAPRFDNDVEGGIENGTELDEDRSP